MRGRLFVVAGLLACSDTLGVASVSPESIDARGGNVVTIEGAGFTSTTSVHIDGLPAGVEVVSGGEMRVTCPALFAGTSTVTVADDGSTITRAKALQIVPLQLRYVQAPSYVLPPIANPVTAAVASDFDGDGDVDLVTCRAGEACRIATNDGHGAFAEPPTVRAGVGGPFSAARLATSALVAADFDGDGDTDLFVGLASDGPGVFELNDGAGTFVASPFVSKTKADPVTAVAAGDVDGDGKIDLVVANAVADSVAVRVYFNRTIGHDVAFVEAASGAVPSADWLVTSLALGDLDGDGQMDILMATPGASDGYGMHLFLGHGTTFETASLEAAHATAPTALAIADLTGDGFADIVAAGPGQDRLLVNDGTGHFFDATTDAMPLDDATATSIAVVDLDRDRHPDLLIGNSSAVTRLYVNDGSGHFQDQSPRFSLDSQKVVALIPTDVDGDGAADVFVFGQDAAVRLFLSVEPLK